jgi:hypothetical protein
VKQLLFTGSSNDSCHCRLNLYPVVELCALVLLTPNVSDGFAIAAVDCARIKQPVQQQVQNSIYSICCQSTPACSSLSVITLTTLS